jgi:hypothetical protein
VEILQLLVLVLLSGEHAATELLSTVNYSAISSQPPCRALMHCQPSNELSAGQGSSLYSLGADPGENTSSSFSIAVIGGCIAIARISFPQRLTEPLLRNGHASTLPLHSNGCTHRVPRGPSLATGLYAIIYICTPCGKFKIF